MIDLTQLAREQEGMFSIKGFKVAFLAPQAYYASSLKDFVDNRKDLKVTEKNLFRRKSPYIGLSYFIIDSCYFKDLREEAAVSLDELSNQLTNKTKFDTLCKLLMNSLQDGEIYDVGSSFKVLTFNNMPPANIKLYNIHLVYNKALDMGRLINYSTTRNIAIKQTDKKYLIDLLFNAVPMPA